MLRKRPSQLLVYVETAMPKMSNEHGEKVYKLPVKARVWARDPSGNAKVRRLGFPIVPGFGGTAHAFCGDTLDAAIDDLLPWHRKPQREDALRAYIIESRVCKVATSFSCNHTAHSFSAKATCQDRICSCR